MWLKEQGDKEYVVRLQNIPLKANNENVVNYVEKHVGKDALLNKETNFRKMTLDRDIYGKSTGICWIFSSDKTII